jgi:hypothetical protein
MARRAVGTGRPVKVGSHWPTQGGSEGRSCRPASERHTLGRNFDKALRVSRFAFPVVRALVSETPPLSATPCERPGRFPAIMEWAAVPAGPRLLDNPADNTRSPRPGRAPVASPNEANRTRPSAPNEPDGRDIALPKRTRRSPHRSPETNPRPRPGRPETNPIPRAPATRTNPTPLPKRTRRVPRPLTETNPTAPGHVPRTKPPGAGTWKSKPLRGGHRPDPDSVSTSGSPPKPLAHQGR